VINATSAVHPMHLHGFYFRVKSRGSERQDSIYAANSAARMVVTERLAPGQTMSMSWVPERPGNWLFHCHDNPHIAANLPLPGAVVAAKSAGHQVNHSREFMGGLVMGVVVKPRGGEPAAAQPDRRRQLRLVARVDTGGTQAEPAYGFVLEESGRAANPAPRLPGPTIVLERGEPVRIMVVNELPEATAIHWHGIELESYYDGVADFAGSSRRIAPAIQPRDSFEVLFTPPRAGTFIYHTHVDEIRQQRAGLSGPLLVVDPARPLDPATDITLMLSVPRRVSDNGIVLVNGSPNLPPLQLQAGTRYRLRIINIHTFRPSMRVELKQGDSFLTWRAVAKDGADLPAELATTRPSAVQFGNGETYDFEFVPAAPGELRIEVLAAVGTLLATVPIHVR
jgi:FtsP/CotA-like multicopper oxidase with cupredoxin domain